MATIEMTYTKLHIAGMHVVSQGQCLWGLGIHWLRSSDRVASAACAVLIVSKLAASWCNTGKTRLGTLDIVSALP